MLTYMRLILEKLQTAGEHLEPKDLAALASEITYFDGVESWFDRMNQYSPLGEILLLMNS